MLNQLSITDFRLFYEVSLSPEKGINLIIGENGSGKTSLLEAIYVLGRGRSFRYRDASPLIREGTDLYRLVAKFYTRDQMQHILGLQRSRNEVLIRLDGKSLVRRSEIFQLLPILWIGTDVQDLIVEGPENRRQFLDTGLFHVEQHYLTYLQQYHRALEQRNAALKTQADLLASWDVSMAEAGEKIDAWRKDYLAKIKQKVSCYFQEWQLEVAVDMQYQPGWRNEVTLLEALQQSQQTDKKLKYTTVGIHRADIVLRTETTKTGKRLSRGQLKMLACAFYFAQAELANGQDGNPFILLFDDLTAELDKKNRTYLLNSIKNLFPQSFITALHGQDILQLTEANKVFHVEHNVVSSS